MFRNMEQLHGSNNDYPTAADGVPEMTGSTTDAAAQENHQRLFQRGLKWLGAGVLLMAVSFGINFFLFDSGSFQTSMYILTSMGAICIMKGLVDMLGF